MDWQRLKGKEKYHAYLASREWKVLVRQVRERCNGTCERCHNSPMDDCHHDTYIRIYREKLTDLRGLCCPCHMFVSGIINEDPAYDSIPIADAPKRECEGCGALLAMGEELNQGGRVVCGSCCFRIQFQDVPCCMCGRHDVDLVGMDKKLDKWWCDGCVQSLRDKSAIDLIDGRIQRKGIPKVNLPPKTGDAA